MNGTRSNGVVVANGTNGTTTNGTNGVTNGVATNGAAATNGLTNGTSGTHHSNGTANGTTDGIANGTTNGTTNGTPPHKLENPTVLPLEELRKFDFTFLIRHPRRSIPSYYRCTIPPLSKVTGFANFMPSEAGYLELRRLFDYLRAEGVVGPHMAGGSTGPTDSSPGSGSGSESGAVSITVVDADDLLDKPAAVIEAFCREVGIDYSPEMLRWEDEENQRCAVRAFAKWNGFHDDVIGSTHLKPRTHSCVGFFYESLGIPRLLVRLLTMQKLSVVQKTATTESDDKEWLEKYGENGRKVIRECVDANVDHYQYLKSFALKV